MNKFPEMHQLCLDEVNPSYLSSLYLGFATPLLHVPVMFFKMVLFPLLANLRDLLMVMVLFPYHGLRGHVTSNHMTWKEAYNYHYGVEEHGVEE